MEVWHVTNGLLVMMETVPVGATFMWVSENSESSAVIELNYLLNSRQASVVHGDCASLSEWAPMGVRMEPWVLEEHTLMVLRQWQERYTPAYLKRTENMRKVSVALMLTDLLNRFDIPAEQERPS